MNFNVGLQMLQESSFKKNAMCCCFFCACTEMSQSIFVISDHFLDDVLTYYTWSLKQNVYKISHFTSFNYDIWKGHNKKDLNLIWFCPFKELKIGHYYTVLWLDLNAQFTMILWGCSGPSHLYLWVEHAFVMYSRRLQQPVKRLTVMFTETLLPVLKGKFTESL